MKVVLIDIDSKIPNLALKKIEKYHLDKGDSVVWNNELMASISDKTYVSCVFDENKEQAKKWEGIAEVGGSGYSLDKVLPLEIENIKLKINMGFTTRGCIRKCQFCIVPQKEGHIRVVGDLLDLWDGKTKDVVILDNNILALPEHFKMISKQAKANKIRLDFNQGLDHRLLTQDIVNDMKSISHIEYRFAYDHPSYLPTVSKAIDLLQANKINRCSWYVLVGFNTTFEQDMERLEYLRSRNQNAYVQRYKTVKAEKKYIALARWVNQHHIFQAMTWKQFIERPENKSYKTYLQQPTEH
jgi:hypothetical protein